MRISNCMWVAVIPVAFCGWLVSGGELNYPPVRPVSFHNHTAGNPRHSQAYGVLWQVRAGAGLQASFRSGQTFLTWKQSEGGEASYRIYRAANPIHPAQDLSAARLLATVDSHSSLNLMACVNRLELSNTRPPREYQLRRRVYFIIREGEPPLSPSTGLYVYTAQANETAYYAVVSSAEPEALMVSGGVAEKIGPIEPVRQNDEVDYVHWSDDGTPYIFRVRTPGGKSPYPMIGILHGALFQYDTPEADRYAKVDGAEAASAIRVALDAPILRGNISGIPARELPPGGWSGKNEDRVLWTLDWVARHYPVDPDRVSLRGESMGGIGSLTIAMLHPERFAAVHAYVPVLTFPQGRDRNPVSSMVRLNPTDYIKSHPEVELPYVMITAGRTDFTVGWPDKLEFARAAQEVKIGFSLYWDARGHTYLGKVPVTWGEPDGMSPMPITAFSRKQSFPAISELSANSNPGTVNLGVRPELRPALDAPGVGDLVGSINGWVDWDRASLSDTANRYAITLRLTGSAPVDTATAQLTPRRLQEFRPVSGRQYRFRVTDAGGKMLRQGRVLADRFGRITIGPVPLTKAGSRLTVQP